MTSFGKYSLSGPDAQKTVDWIFSADMGRPSGSTIYTCMLNNRGGVEADLTVVSLVIFVNSIVEHKTPSHSGGKIG